MRSSGFRRTWTTAAIAAAFALTAAACGTSSTDEGGGSDPGSDAGKPLDKKAKVTISIDCMPTKTKDDELKGWNRDIKAFKKLYPNVTIKGKATDPCLEPPRFTAMLKAKSQPDVFYAYFTDRQQILDNDAAQDITPYVNNKTVPALGDISGNVLNDLKSDDKLYGLPREHYSMGLLVNRKLFKKAGLDPDKPPTTWEEVRSASKKIAGLGGGVNGFGIYSATNQGGWHFTASVYSRGGSVVTPDGKKAAFNDDTGKAVLQQLKDMRFKDESMGKTQLLKWGDLQKQMVSDKLGMFLAAPDDLNMMAQQLDAEYSRFGMGPIPGQKYTLTGGDAYYVKKGISPEKTKAAIAWLNFRFLSQGKGRFDWPKIKTDGLPVGLPQPDFWTGETRKKDDAAREKDATVPVENFQAFRDNPVPGKTEPAKAQEVYKILDVAMSTVLTNKNADVDKLLDTAEQQVNQVLANG
ncbi:extracellular solute-binding protein [Streptomyces sp. A7024]|uniref:Extracellular solute-binding protein n=1 Tax=Streptomyces coryli TaxID=1128680 RepID=A0A6G4U072_9ACTN|nr:extracellular solute-binding protein [Streptomyces coryli]NGN65106.1 extracellular solute-binding protein [Streptomyces coryli]